MLKESIPHGGSQRIIPHNGPGEFDSYIRWNRVKYFKYSLSKERIRVFLESRHVCQLRWELNFHSYVFESEWNGFHEKARETQFWNVICKTAAILWLQFYDYIYLKQTFYWSLSSVLLKIHPMNRYWWIANGIGFVTQHTKSIIV